MQTKYTQQFSPVLHALSSAPLTKLFNNLLETSIIPVEWKSSIICPIYKEGSKNDVANCTPICHTSVTCTILERILKAYILQYLKTVSLLSDAQHGFVPRRSCLTNLIISNNSLGLGDCGEDVAYP